MPLHPQAKALIEQLAALGDPPLEESTPGEVRALRASRIPPPAVDLPEIRDVDAGGVPSRLYRPESGRELGLFVYVHGGGWVLGNLDTHDHVARALARESGHAVLSIDYRLAPEHPFPAGLEDTVAAFRWAREHASELGCDPDRVAVGGDSSGANLATVAIQLDPHPYRLQLLVYPVTDARASTSSYAEFREGPFLTAAGMNWFIDHYLAGRDALRGNPRVSPLLAGDSALVGSPPALVVTAELDVLRDEGEAYAGRLRALGVPVTATRYDGMFHGFFAFAEHLDAGREAIAAAAAALADALR